MADQDAETVAYMARRAVCRRCGDALVPSPTIIGMWLTDRKGIGRGLCPDGSMHDPKRTDGGAPAEGEAATAAGTEN